MTMKAYKSFYIRTSDKRPIRKSKVKYNYMYLIVCDSEPQRDYSKATDQIGLSVYQPISVLLLPLPPKHGGRGRSETTKEVMFSGESIFISGITKRIKCQRILIKISGSLSTILYH